MWKAGSKLLSRARIPSNKWCNRNGNKRVFWAYEARYRNIPCICHKPRILFHPRQRTVSTPCRIQTKMSSNTMRNDWGMLFAEQKKVEHMLQVRSQGLTIDVFEFSGFQQTCCCSSRQKRKQKFQWQVLNSTGRWLWSFQLQNLDGQSRAR